MIFMIDGRENCQYNKIIEMNVKFDDEFLENILITAFEGGSNYWINSIDISNPNGSIEPKDVATSEWAFDALKCGGFVDIDHGDYLNGGEKEINRINLSDLIHGVNKFVNNYTMKLSDTDIFDNEFALDAGQFDADMADQILQYAVFGDVIYG